PQTKVLDCGESGLGIRLFTPLAALSDQALTIQGRGSLVQRPMDFFDEVLPQLGVGVSTQGGKLPLQVKGPLQARSIQIDGSLSSQFLTGLLMAFATTENADVVIEVKDLKSKPYIDLTLSVLAHFGWEVVHENHTRFRFQARKPQPEQINYTVEGDWSGAAFLLVAGAIAGSVTVTGLDVFSTQADKAILLALGDAGARLSVREDAIEVSALPLKAFHFDATDCPDLFPPLVALAACCSGKTVIEGVSRLAHKESHRGLTLQEAFGKMGIQIQLQDDLMIIEGGEAQGGEVFSHHDHRIAMATAVLALRANGPLSIRDAEAINKSYPAFYQDLKMLQGSTHNKF
ncbi:MAG: 3-phosphoshikimate 1-carboxyvinyltransferase, partial [Sphingobacteriia bacterium]